MVVTDMDGTLLHDDGTVPAAFWPLLERMRAQGITFVPASGRQHAALSRDFAGRGPLHIIAENGALLTHDGTELFSRTLEAAAVRDMLAALREVAARENLGVVLCGKRSAYIERQDAHFREQARHYYAALEPVEDLLAVQDDFLKIAVCDLEEDAARLEDELTGIAAGHRLVVSGPKWADIMRPDVDKGHALAHLQAELGVTPAETVAFGDYLNDLGMLARAEHAYAMDNAHPDVLAAARNTAGTNASAGVVRVLDGLLG
nr:HAD family hydrolase [Zhihengliuella flava]